MKINTAFKNALIVTALAMTFGSEQARAIPLVPGTAVPPDTDVIPSSSLLATVSDGFSTGGGLALMTGTVTTRVYAPDLAYNPFGGLTFTYDIHITTAVTAHTMQSLSLIDWLGFIADARQTAAGAQASTASLDLGGTVHFNFNSPGATSTFGSGNSATLILATDALSYKKSFFSVQDGLADNGNSLAPTTTTTVPDGGVTVFLLGIGFLGLGIFRKSVTA